MTLSTVFTYFANSLWQVPLLALCCWCALRLARAQARVRYAAWIATLLLCVSLPLRGTLPRTDAQVTVTTGDAMVVGNGRATPPSLPFYSVQISPRTRDVLAWLYVAAAGFFLLRLLLAYAAQSRLLRRTVAARFSPAHQALLTELGADAARIRILPAGLGAPMVTGVWRPCVLLPEALLAGNDTTLRAVLAHELAHLARRDTVVNLVLRAVALPVAYHPATAVIERQIRNARELLCDQVAARSLPSASLYAQALLQLAQDLVHTGGEVPGGTVGLFERTSRPLLEERIMNLIAPPAPLHPGFRWLRASAAAAVFCAAVCTAAVVHLTPSVLAAEQTAGESVPAQTVVPGSAATAVPSGPLRFVNGSAYDPTPLKTKARDPQTERKSAELRRQLSSVANSSAGDSVRGRTFASGEGQRLPAYDSKSPCAPPLLCDSFGAPSNADLNSAGFWGQTAEATRVKVMTKAELAKLIAGTREPALGLAPPAFHGAALPQEPGRVRVSAGIMQGAMRTKVAPVYPPEAKAAGISGSVVLHAIIARDGSVSRLDMVSGPVELQSSAMDAVRQWVYQPYLLNGQPTEVETTITVNYSLGG